MQGLIRNNFQLKVISVIMSIILFGYANLSQNAQLQVTMPVALQGVGDGMLVADSSVAEIRLLLRGPKAALAVVQEQAPNYGVDIGALGAGQHELQIDMTAIQLPRGIDILQIAPLQIDLDVRRTQKYERPVKARLKGQPAAGYRIVAVEIDPERVELETAVGALDGVDTLLTQSVDIDGKAEDVVLQAQLDLADLPIKTAQTRTVSVAVRIQPIIRQSRIGGIPVTIQGLQSAEWRVSPQTVSIEVMGADAALKALEQSDIQARVFLEAPPKQNEPFPVSLKLPPDVTLLAVTPQTVVVTHAQ